MPQGFDDRSFNGEIAVRVGMAEEASKEALGLARAVREASIRTEAAVSQQSKDIERLAATVDKMATNVESVKNDVSALKSWRSNVGAVIAFIMAATGLIWIVIQAVLKLTRG